MDPWYPEDEVDRLVLSSITASRGEPVELEDVFERIDAAERTVFAQDVMDASLRRLGSAGKIRQVGAAFVDAERSSMGEFVDGLSPEVYTLGLRAYRVWFARTSAELFGGGLLRSMTAEFIDPDLMVIGAVVDEEVALVGGTADRLGDDPDRFEASVRGLDVGTAIDDLVARIRERVAAIEGGPSIVRLTLEDGMVATIRPTDG